MSTLKSESLSEVWAARYDDRDDEDIACEMWARRLASRDLAMAQPFKNFPMADEMTAERDKPQSPAERDKPQSPAERDKPQSPAETSHPR